MPGTAAAEIAALQEEAKTQLEKRYKAEEMEIFRAKTASSAQRTLKQNQKAAKLAAETKEFEKREKLLKTREFAAQQRTNVVKKAQQKK